MKRENLVMILAVSQIITSVAMGILLSPKKESGAVYESKTTPSPNAAISTEGNGMAYGRVKYCVSLFKTAHNPNANANSGQLNKINTGAVVYNLNDLKNWLYALDTNRVKNISVKFGYYDMSFLNDDSVKAANARSPHPILDLKKLNGRLTTFLVPSAPIDATQTGISTQRSASSTHRTAAAPQTTFAYEDVIGEPIFDLGELDPTP